MIPESNANLRQFPHDLGLRGDHAVVAAAAHELCNHLQVIGSAMALLKRAMNGAAMPAADLIFSGADTSLERARLLSRRIVDWEGAADAERCRLSIGDRLAALRDVVLLATGPAILVEYLQAENVPDVLCDPDAFDDALLNLIVNAAQAMPDGGRISITAMRAPASEGIFFPSAVLRVADTGCGMPAEVAARAFEHRFTTKLAGEGSGVGLAMVAAFARSAGGSAEIESQPGIGTVVTVRLPGLLKHAKAARAAEK